MFLLLVFVTVGNLALGFALACLLGHGPKWRQVRMIAEPILAPILAEARYSRARLIAVLSTRSASARDDAANRGSRRSS